MFNKQNPIIKKSFLKFNNKKFMKNLKKVKNNQSIKQCTWKNNWNEFLCLKIASNVFEKFGIQFFTPPRLNEQNVLVTLYQNIFTVYEISFKHF